MAETQTNATSGEALVMPGSRPRQELLSFCVILTTLCTQRPALVEVGLDLAVHILRMARTVSIKQVAPKQHGPRLCIERAWQSFEASARDTFWPWDLNAQSLDAACTHADQATCTRGTRGSPAHPRQAPQAPQPTEAHGKGAQRSKLVAVSCEALFSHTCVLLFSQVKCAGISTFSALQKRSLSPTRLDL